MAYYKNPIIYPTGRISQDTAKINENFTELAKAFVNEDPTTYKVINADKVDDYHANQIPMPNTIPVSDNTGKLNLNWIPQGSGSGLNADQVDGFHASQTPSANTIPVAGADGKLDAGWLPSISSIETYSKMTVGTSLPASPQHNDLFYNTSDNTLRKYDAKANTWTTIDWQTIVRASPEWRAGRLRINSSTGRLEISPDGANWYECIPAVGSQAIVLTDLTQRYFFLPFSSALIDFTNVSTINIPIFCEDCVFDFYLKTITPSFQQGNGTYYYSILLYPNFTSISGAFYSATQNWDNSPGGSAHGLNTEGFVIAFYCISVNIRATLFCNVLTKSVIYENVHGGSNTANYARRQQGSSAWNDFSTRWLWIGTVNLVRATTGMIIVTRRA